MLEKGKAKDTLNLVIVEEDKDFRRMSDRDVRGLNKVSK